MQGRGIDITLPLVNEANFDFIPDEKNNRIIFSLKSLNGIGDDIARVIVENRPYDSLEDFCKRLIETKLIGTAQMVQLIKAGCFTELHDIDRTKTMNWFLRKYVFTPCDKLTMQQLGRMKQMNIIPEDLDLAQRMIAFKKYVLDEQGLVEKHIDPNKKMVKRGYHDGYYILDDNSQPFFQKYFTEDSVIRVSDGFYVISEKLFTKEVDKKIQPLQEWFEKQETLNLYNDSLYKEIWDKYASGTIPEWEMSSLCIYHSEHELKNLNYKHYGVVNFFELPEDPIPYDHYVRYYNGVKTLIPKNRIDRLAGTVIDSNNTRHTITLLTRDGVVECKFNRGHYGYYSKRLTQQIEHSDKKKVIEESWFKRGTKLLVSGYRQGSIFRVYRYNDSVFTHTVNRIIEVKEDGTLTVQAERTKIK